MSTTVLIFAPGSASPVSAQTDEWAWAAIDPATGVRVTHGSGTLDTMPALEDGDKVHLILDGTRVTVLSEVLPARSDAQARKTAPFVLEERLAGEPGTTHVAVGPLAEDKRPIVLCDKAWLTEHLETLAEHDIQPATVYADHMIFRHSADTAALVVQGSKVLLAKPDGITASVDSTLASLIAPTFLNGVTEVQASGDIPPDLRRALEVAEIAVTSLETASDAKLCSLLATRATSGTLINMMQGEFAPKRDWNTVFKKARRPLVLVGLLAGAVLASLFFEANSLHRTADRLTKEANTVMQAAMPGVRNLSHMESRVRAQKIGRSDEFLMLSAVLFDAAQGIDALSFVSLRYDADRAVLTASVNASQYSDVAALKAAVENRGVQLSEGTSRQSGSRVLADVTLTLGGGS